MTMRFVSLPGRMSGLLLDVAAFPGEVFDLNIPEEIGDIAQITSEGSFLRVDWVEQSPGQWFSTGRLAGECSYEVTLVLTDDTVDIQILLTNESNRVWQHGTAFNHFSPHDCPSVRDFEVLRHWVRVGDVFQPLSQLPRVFSGRPGVQVFNVLGAPPVSQLPFANAFQATPSFTAEGWIAIQSRDGSRLVAIVAKPALFLFQNSEFTCIHAAPDFGTLAPGQFAVTQTRIYFVQSTLLEWYTRMRGELF